MKTKLFIKNKKLKTSILIKNNYIFRFIESIAKQNEKTFCILDSKVKIDLKFNKYKNIEIIYIKGGEKIKSLDIKFI